jgi:hypothetical protein
MARESRGKTTSDWPSFFDEFSSDDDAAAQAWFSKPHNLVFTSWDKCVGENAGHWAGLELSLQKITGQTSADVSQCGKNAVKEVLASSTLNKHTTTKQKEQIGKAASENLRKKMVCGWRNASMPWVEQACRALVPRFTHLWKKTARKAESAEPAASELGEATPPPRSKRQRLLNGSVQTPALQSHLSLVLPRKMPAAKASHSTAPVEQRRQDQFLLCDRDLEVRMEQAAEEMELDAVEHVTVAITAIVCDEALMYDNNSIRPEHLSFDKFCRILERTDPNFGWKSNGKFLTWDGPEGQKPIEHETGFQIAVGVLAWAANNKGSERVLVMRIRARTDL